jgi:hypothetical protein
MLAGLRVWFDLGLNVDRQYFGIKQKMSGFMMVNKKQNSFKMSLSIIIGVCWLVVGDDGGGEVVVGDGGDDRGDGDEGGGGKDDGGNNRDGCGDESDGDYDV